ncbi:hypothetical protein GCM10027563_26640 [Parasphingorhabdus pacifica]
MRERYSWPPVSDVSALEFGPITELNVVDSTDTHLFLFVPAIGSGSGTACVFQATTERPGSP